MHASSLQAVVEDRNQQYRVTPGDRLLIALNDSLEEGATLTFDRVCVLTGAEPKIGTPYVEGASVRATVVRNQVRGQKLIVQKFKRRKGYRRRTGFRARFTEIRIDSIDA